jgi:nucleoside-diphosphate-sugar epimerase
MENISNAYSPQDCTAFIFASTVGVHGSQYTVIDKDTPIKPENHYAVSKYLSEEVIKACLQNYSILRICGIYGLDGPEHLGLNRAISNAVHKKNVPVLMGPGKAKRNYICVQDVARWISRLVNNYETVSRSTKTGIKEVLYFASSETMTVEEYLELITETILGGIELERKSGPESLDLVVRASHAPFPQLIFRQYLSMLTS